MSGLKSRAPRVRWTPRPVEELSFTPCSLAVQPWDELTQSEPLGALRVVLEREGPTDTWRPGPRAVVTPSGIHAWWRLEHRRSAVGAPPVRYRLSVDSGLYVPAFRESKDHELVLVQPYDDRGPPPPPPTAPLRVPLYPSVAYPFEPSIPVLRGSVVDDSGPVRDALLKQGSRERTLTDEDGQFALPVRWVVPGLVTLHIQDRKGRATSHKVTLPQALSQAVTITLR